jgi:hypothetical protein
MKQHISRAGAILANACIKKCNELISLCQKLRDDEHQNHLDKAVSSSCAEKSKECIESCGDWSDYCQEHREECNDEDCNIMYGDALAKSDECIKACGDLICEITEGNSPQRTLDACIECVEIADECIEECARILKKHL